MSNMNIGGQEMGEDDEEEEDSDDDGQSRGTDTVL